MTREATARTRPLRIGVSACFLHADPQRNIFKGKTLLYAEESMLALLMSAGAVPIMIPRARPPITAADLLVDIDGLILQGGADMAPESYGETPLRPEWAGDRVRDVYELELVRLCLELDRPLLGICRGHQVLNVAFGGSLFQDVETQHPERRVHRNWELYDHHAHDVALEPGSVLARWYGHPVNEARPLHGRINSVHHQAVKEVGRGLVVEARSLPDGLVEAIRTPGVGGDDGPFALGVQWHPEFMEAAQLAPEAGWLAPQVIVRGFLDEARARRQRREAV